MKIIQYSKNHATIKQEWQIDEHKKEKRREIQPKQHGNEQLDHECLRTGTPPPRIQTLGVVYSPLDQHIKIQTRFESTKWGGVAR